MKVTVAELGGRCESVTLPEDATVKDALVKFGYDINSSKTVTVNQEPADVSTLLEDGDMVTVVPRVTGN